jgi:hypothetical protein
VIVYRAGRRIVIEDPAEQLDEYGWPTNFWEIFGAAEPGFDVGVRAVAHEREDPFEND